MWTHDIRRLGNCALEVSSNLVSYEIFISNWLSTCVELFVIVRPMAFLWPSFLFGSSSSCTVFSLKVGSRNLFPLDSVFNSSLHLSIAYDTCPVSIFLTSPCFFVVVPLM